MLPFGLTTDVSAGALAAGAGGALGAGAAGAAAGGGTLSAQSGGVFAEELKAAAGQGAATGPASEAAGPVADFKVPLPAGPAGEVIQVLKVAAEEPVVAAPQSPAPFPAPTQITDATGGDVVVTPAPEELAEDTANAEGVQTPEEIAEAILSAAEAVPVPVAPAPPVAQTEGTVQIQVASSSGGASAAGPQGHGVPGGMLPGEPGGQMPAPPAMANPNAANGLQRAAAAGPEAAGQPVADAAAGQAAVSTGRRWRNELPAELRAPVPQAAQARSAAPQNLTVQMPAGTATAATPPLPAGNGQPGSALPSAGSVTDLPAVPPSGTPAPAGSQPASAQAQPSPLSLAQAPGSQPAGTPAAMTNPTLAQAAPSSMTATPATAFTVVATPAQPAVAVAKVPLTVQPDEVLATEPVPDETLSLNKPGAVTTAQQTAAKQAAAPAGGPGGESAGARPVSTSAVAAPLEAAALAAAVSSEEAELSVSSLEPGTGSDFTSATVRGGDLHGAMRTESLQTPTQTQSAHVATQVAAEIARNLKNGQTHFQMRFDPPELGRVEVNMRVGADGSVQAHLIVDRPETLDMFLRDQRGLERALEAAGLNTNSDNLQFSLKQDGGQNFASNQGDGEQQPGFGDKGSDADGETDPDQGDRVRLMLAEQRGGLDMKV